MLCQPVSSKAIIDIFEYSYFTFHSSHTRAASCMRADALLSAYRGVSLKFDPFPALKCNVKGLQFCRSDVTLL